MLKIVKPLIVCACLLGLQACGGSQNPISEDLNNNVLDTDDSNTDNSNQDDSSTSDIDSGDDQLTQEEVSFFKLVLTDLYNDNQKSLSYVDEIEALVNNIDNFQAVPAAGAFDMNGAFIISDVGDNASDTAVGLIDLAVSIDDGTFAGSASDFVQVNESSVDPVDTFTGTLNIEGTAAAAMIDGTAAGTLTNQSQESFDLNFGMTGAFTQTEDGSIAVVGEGQDANLGLEAVFIAVEY